MIVPLLILTAAILLLIYVWKRDPGSPLIAVLLGLILVMIVLLASHEVSGSEWSFRHVSYWLIAIFAGLPILGLIGSMGFWFSKRETSTLREVRPIGVGVLSLAIYLVVSIVFTQKFVHVDLIGVGLGVLGVVTVVGGYLLVMSFGYGLHALLFVLAKRPVDPDFIIVNGTRLEDGELTPLLESRLDTAIALYNKGGGRATIIPSGGWTSDDVVSEADAMVQYLLARAIPGEQIVPEDQPISTRENLENSRLIIQMRSGSAPATVAYVTSNFHVYRTGLIARSIGLEAHGVGSTTPGHQMPASILHELTALFWMHKYWHALPILAATVFYQVAVLPSERY